MAARRGSDALEDNDEDEVEEREDDEEEEAEDMEDREREDLGDDMDEQDRREDLPRRCCRGRRRGGEAAWWRL